MTGIFLLVYCIENLTGVPTVFPLFQKFAWFYASMVSWEKDTEVFTAPSCAATSFAGSMGSSWVTSAAAR